MKKPAEASPIDTIAASYNLSRTETIAKLLTEPVYTQVAMKGSLYKGLFMPGRSFNERPTDLKNYEVIAVFSKPSAANIPGGSFMLSNAKALITNISKDLGIDVDKWYVTAVPSFIAYEVEKFTPSKAIISDCMQIFNTALDIIKPKLIVLFGAELVKYFISRRDNLSALRGSTDLEYKGYPVIATVHPGAVFRDDSVRESFIRDFKLVANKLNGTETVEVTKQYTVIDTAPELKQIVDSLLASGIDRYAVDCEWGGVNGSDFNNGGRLRSVQFAIAPGVAFLVKLRSSGLINAFSPNIAEAAKHLRRLFCHESVQICGHNFRADIKWLDDMAGGRSPDCIEMNIPCMPAFQRGFDTMLGYHVLKPYAEGFGLEQVVSEYTNLGRYDLPVQRWLKLNGYDKKRLQEVGYADIPDDLLHPYAMADVDAVIQAWPVIEEQLKELPVAQPYTLNGTSINTLYDFYKNIVHAVVAPIDEIERTGLLADKERMIVLVKLMETYSTKMLADFRKLIDWPTFNMRAIKDVRYLLYGTNLPDVEVEEGKKTLSLFPVKTTEKPPRNWDKLSPDDMRRVNPAIDSETLQVLSESIKDEESIKVVDGLRRLKFIDQQGKNFLRPPEESESPDEEPEWTGGLVHHIDFDGRIRTSIGQLTDTGRYTSYRPNMQNLSKKQEAELRLIFATDEAKLEAYDKWQSAPEEELKEKGLLHPDYYSLRSCFVADPGCVLIEADYVQAELNVMAHLSGDKEMIAIMNDPTRDLHSEMAIIAFKLKCEPKEVKKLYPKQRVMAKNVNFGIAYGRGANALVRQARAEGVIADKESMQLLINTFFERFTAVRVFIAKCHENVINLGYVENAFGRRRYFPKTTDTAKRAGYLREGQNSPIQGTVAEALSISLCNLQKERSLRNMKYKIALPVHDAIFLVAPMDEAKIITSEVLPLCMTENCPIPNTKLKLKTDISIMDRWGHEIEIE